MKTNSKASAVSSPTSARHAPKASVRKSTEHGPSAGQATIIRIENRVCDPRNDMIN